MSDKKKKSRFSEINEKYSFLDDGVEGLKDRNTTRANDSRREQDRNSAHSRENIESRRQYNHSRESDFRDHTIKMNPEAIKKEKRRMEIQAKRERDKKLKRRRMVTVGISVLLVIVLAFTFRAILDRNLNKINPIAPSGSEEVNNSKDLDLLKGFVITTKSTKFYEENDSSSIELGEIPASTYLEKYGTIGDFTKIKYNGTEGFVYSANISLVESENQLKVKNGILIVNNEFSLPEDFSPGLNTEGKSNFDIMVSKAKTDGVTIKIASDFRSFEQQKNNAYTDGVSNYGEYNMEGTPVKAGFSEHQTGLAFDIVGEDYELRFTNGFAETEEYQWVLENAHKYGFILRYPSDKEEITGRKYEPWHLRFVGTKIATEIFNKNISLEEYTGIVSISSNNEKGNTQQNDQKVQDN